MRANKLPGSAIPTAPRYVVPFLLVGVGLTLIFVLNLIFPQVFDNTFRYQKGAGLWRLVTYILVHEDVGHLVFNLIALFAIYVMFMEHFARFRLAIFTPLAALAGGLGVFWLSPQVHLLYGFSSVLYALFAAGALFETFRPEPGRRTLGVIMLTAVVLKTSFDLYVAPAGLAVSAHAGGVAFGLVWATVLFKSGQARL